ncbi:MAG: signal transduction protein [Solirubrobacterales bacterium]|nr:signal transduction protein [Solirubrobacterales bacterium]
MIHEPPPGTPVLDERLSWALDASGLMDSQAEVAFDRLTRRAKALLVAPSVVMTLVNPPRQAFKSRAGRDVADVPLAQALCRRVVDTGAPLAVPDTSGETEDGAARPAGVAAFAGMPTRTTGGDVLGSLCAFDGAPRTWTTAELGILESFAATAAAAVELRLSQFTTARAVSLSDGQSAILRQIAQGEGLAQTLEAIVRHIERHAGDSLGSVLLLSDDGRRLQHGAGPSLPAAYREALDGSEIGDDVGSCGAAAYLGELVIVADIATDPRWVNFRSLALEHGLRACWAKPIFAADGTVVGTFAFYYREARAPTATELELIEDAAALAGIAIERERTQRTLVDHATRDPLTGLWNRRVMLAHLNRRRTPAETLAVVYFIDIDRFKLVNDTLGHDVGDKLLQAVASRLERITRDGDVLTRLGGDEMALFATGVGSREEAEAFARRLLRALEVPFELAGTSLQVRVSVGVAIADPSTSGEALLGAADKAMYRVKSEGGDAYAVYDDTHHTLRSA